jgi:uncharacterized membrane protein YidH (DUF202 family)
MVQAVPDRDPGLQPERTRLAWRRTTLACTAATVLAWRQLLRGGAPATTSVAIAAVSLALLVFLAAAHRRIRAMNAPRPPALSPRVAALLAGCAITLAAVGMTALL